MHNPLIIGLPGEQPAAESNASAENSWQPYVPPAQTSSAENYWESYAPPAQTSSADSYWESYAPPAHSSTAQTSQVEHSDLIQLGRNTYNNLIWPGAVGNPAADNHVAAILPIYPTVQQAQQFGSQQTNAILVSTAIYYSFIDCSDNYLGIRDISPTPLPTAHYLPPSTTYSPPHLPL